MTRCRLYVRALSFQNFWQLAALDLALAQVSMDDEGNLFFFSLFFYSLRRSAWKKRGISVWVHVEGVGYMCMGVCVVFSGGMCV